MIDDLSRSLRALLQQPGGPKELTEAHVVFDHPNESFKPTEPTLDLFLYDLRENAELRNAAPLPQPRPGDRFALVRPPLRLTCSYLVTAWPSGGGELPLLEQQLLGQVLVVLRRHPVLPVELLQGRLKEQPLPIPVDVAQAGPKDAHEFWSAIGNRMRPSINISATVAIEPLDPPEVVGRAKLHEVRITQR